MRDRSLTEAVSQEEPRGKRNGEFRHGLEKCGNLGEVSGGGDTVWLSGHDSRTLTQCAGSSIVSMGKELCGETDCIGAGLGGEGVML